MIGAQKHAYLSGGMDTVQLGFMFSYIKEAQSEMCAMLEEIREMMGGDEEQ